MICYVKRRLKPWNVTTRGRAGWKRGGEHMEIQLEAPVRKVVAFFHEHGYDYAIVGGLAFSQWGEARATMDADFKVIVPDQDYAAMRATLRRAFPQPARLQAPDSPLIVAAEVDGVIVDFLLAISGYDELIVKRAVERDFGGWTARVCTPEDLIVQKVIAGRPKDWADVESLLIVQHNQIDYSYVDYWLGQFAEALDTRDFLEHYRSLVERVRAIYASRKGDKSA